MPLLPSDASVAPLLVLAIATALVAIASWVYRDARAHVADGRPIVYSSGDLRISTPAGWFVACVLLFELFIPVYLDRRHPA